MKKITVFASPLCPDCPPFIDYLNKNHINYDYIDITESMGNLKIFLKFRDENPFFDEVKSNGYVGIPVVMIGDGVEFISGDKDIDLDMLK